VSGGEGGNENDGGSVTAALGIKWAHCVNTRWDSRVRVYG